MSDFNPFDQMTFTNDRCFLCGELLTDDNRSKEHVYPKWLQNKFNLWNASLILLNNTPIRYKDLTIPCCKRCNGIMSNKIEKPVQHLVDGGYDAFVKVLRKELRKHGIVLPKLADYQLRIPPRRENRCPGGNLHLLGTARRRAFDHQRSGL